MMRNTLLLFLLLASGQAAYCQDAPTRAKGTSPDALQTFFSAPEQVLPRLYEAAIAHSGEVERLDALHNVADEDVKLAKKHILNSVALSTGYTYGTLPYFATAESSASPVYLPNPFGLGARAQFNIGAGIVLPLDMLASRNTNICRHEYVVDQTIAHR